MFPMKSAYPMNGSTYSPSSLTCTAFVIIGGGVAGSTCAIELKRLCPLSKVTIVSPASIVKTVRSVEKITPLLQVVNVQESTVDEFTLEHPGISLVREKVISVDPARGEAKLSTGQVLHFSRCCVATGASPSLAAIHPRVIGIRDIESVENLSKWITGARRVLIVGNGGIALELVHALISTQACQVAWAVRDSFIGNTFFDPSASAFFLASLSVSDNPEEAPTASNSSVESTTGTYPSQLHRDKLGAQQAPVLQPELSSEKNENVKDLPEPRRNLVGSKTAGNKNSQNTDCVAPRIAGSSVGEGTSPVTYGGGAGPEWIKILEAQGLPVGSGSGDKNSLGIQGSTKQSMLDIQFGAELESVRDGVEKDGECRSWPLLATLTNGREIDCDFVVSATGVEPNTDVLGPQYQRGPNGGLLVDNMMKVVRSWDLNATPGEERHVNGSAQGLQDTIYAAGDCCCLEWPTRESAHWFQLRLWAQARAMGLYTAKCMADAVDELGSCGAFDLFVHATQFFGHKVSLLGHFNGQGLEPSTRDFVSKQLLVDHDRGTRCQRPGEDAESGEGHGYKANHQDSGNPDQTADLKVLVRATPGLEYIKVILERGRVRGAMLIGDTGLEETFENLILNGTDVSAIEDDLLSVDVDLEDFFD